MEENDIISEIDIKKTAKPVAEYYYQLGEEIANGVKFWRKIKVLQKVNTAAMVCPMCGELFTESISKVVRGSIKGCKRCKIK